MVMHKIIKQQLLHEELEPNVLKLARILYNTYIEDEHELSMEVKIQALIKIFKLQDNENPIKYIKYLLEELNEPLCVDNFKFYTKTYEKRFIYFCTYNFRENYIDIELSEEYFFAIENYMIKPYL